MGFSFDNTQLRTTPYILNYIYSGQLFTVYHEYVSVAAGASVYLQTNVGVRSFHTIGRNVQISENGPLVISLWEGATFTDGTTRPEVDRRNLDRRIGAQAPPTANLFVNPTAVSLVGATLISREKIYAVGNKAPLAFQSANVERILPVNSRYLLQFNNTGAQPLSLTVEVLFYESRN